MVKKTICLAALVLLAAPVLAEDTGAGGPPVDKKVGYALLDAIGQVANAVADEIINLHLYLDNIEIKEKLRKAWDEKFSAAQDKKKDGDQ